MNEETFELDSKLLETYRNQLSSNTEKLSKDIEILKQKPINQKNTQISIDLIEKTIIPILKKYSNTLQSIIEQTNTLEKERIE